MRSLSSLAWPGKKGSRLKKIHVVLVGLAVLSASGCRSVDYDPGIFKKQSFALVSFYGPQNIEARTGLIGGFESMNGWGKALLEEAGAEATAKITSTLPSCSVPRPETLAKTSYSQLKASFRPADKIASLPGLRPVPTGVWSNETLDLKGLGNLAGELNVDAVVLVEFIDWVVTDVYRSTGKKGSQHGWVQVQLIIVGADGKQLWKQGVQLDGPDEDLSAGSIGRQISGSTDKKTAVSRVHAAVVAALDKFAVAWNAKRAP